MEWTFELTHEAIPDLQTQFEWALQHRNQAFGAPVSARSVMRGISIVSVAAFATVFLIAGSTHYYVLAVLAGLAIGTALRSLRTSTANMTTTSSRFDRALGTRLGDVAAGAFASVAAKAPYQIRYTLTDGQLLTDVDGSTFAPVELASVTRVIAAESIVFVFVHALAQKPARTIYVGDPATRAALVAAFEAVNVPVQRITGGVASYMPRLPEARIST